MQEQERYQWLTPKETNGGLPGGVGPQGRAHSLPSSSLRETGTGVQGPYLHLLPGPPMAKHNQEPHGRHWPIPAPACSTRGHTGSTWQLGTGHAAARGSPALTQHSHRPRRARATRVCPALACIPSTLHALAKVRERCGGRPSARRGHVNKVCSGDGGLRGDPEPWLPPPATLHPHIHRASSSHPSGLPERASSESSSLTPHPADPGRVGARAYSLNGGARQPWLCVLPGNPHQHCPRPSTP